LTLFMVDAMLDTMNGNLFQRELYLNQIRPFIGKPFIKVITGLRRSGKSGILRLLSEYFAGRVDSRHVIYLDLENFEDPLDASGLHDRVKAALQDDASYYLLLDEVQVIRGWERVVNSLFARWINGAGRPVDIYVTGSNSHLLSSELATLLAGRYVEITVRPLSFNEYLDFNTARGLDVPPSAQAVWDYIERGGFPALHAMDMEQGTTRRAVQDIYASILLRDTIQRYKIRNIDLLERLVRFIFDNTGNLFSAKSITDYMRNQRRKVDEETIYNYIKALESAFLIKKVHRYDIRGKELLNFREKYYPGDISLTYAALGFDMKRISGIIETLIFTELERRGFSVYVGKLDEGEVDFVGVRNGEKVYVQAAYLLGDNPETLRREFSPLQAIRDNFPKYVVSLDERWSDSVEGIRRLHLADFLEGNYL